jgi:Histidine kinase-, DNA gyrase B-, and HSP90-like ATPase
MVTTTAATEPEELLEQRRLVEKLETSGGWDIIVGDAFVRGMRDIGYKSTSYALAEIVDNAVEAAAQHVDIVFGFNGGKMPTLLAAIDDGYGMEPKMTRAALIWGAGTRAERRSGWGKYGYGLPSASVSQCQRVSVYSKTAGGSWYTCYLDVEEISRGDWTKANRLEMPSEKAEMPPAFVIDFLKKAGRWDSFDHGTVVIWDKLDRIDFKQREALRSRLVTDLGVIYRNVLVDVPMTVDGERVQPCDPLFTTPTFRGYDIDEDRAEAQEPATAEVTDKDSGEVLGRLRVRYSYMPPTFFRQPEYKHTNRAGRARERYNERLDIASANDGVIFCRDGRQIDHIRPPRSFGSINVTTDRFWAVEVDFDNSLDSFFAITTSKQQVHPDERIWNILRDKANMFSAIATMRTRYEREAKAIAAKADADKETKRASIAAIEAAEKFRTTPPPTETQERLNEAEKNLETEVKRRAEKAGVGTEIVRHEIEAQQLGNPRVVETEEMPGGPFYRCVALGGQRVLYLNVAHTFYTELYTGPGSSPRLRAGLEILLWALGEAEIDAEPSSDKRLFYELERSQVWSPYLASALTQLQGLPLMELPAEPADDEVDTTAA